MTAKKFNYQPQNDLPNLPDIKTTWDLSRLYYKNENDPQIEKDIIDVGGRARDGKISIEEMQGGTFTITNGGVFGSLMATPILIMLPARIPMTRPLSRSTSPPIPGRPLSTSNFASTRKSITNMSIPTSMTLRWLCWMGSRFR